MTIVVEAVYQNGILKPKQPLSLAEGTEVRLTVTPATEPYDPLEEVLVFCDEGPDFSLAAQHDDVIRGTLP